MSYAAHMASIAQAIDALELMQQSISVLTAQSQRAASAVASATGGNNCLSDSGREAFEMAIAFEGMAQEFMSRTTLCASSLVGYRNGL